MPVIMDLAARFHMGLEQAASLIGRAAEGGGTMLKRLLPDFDVATAKAEGFSNVLEQVSAHVNGAAQAEMGTYQGQVKLLDAQFEKTKETLGEMLMPVLRDVTADFIDFHKETSQSTGGLKALAEMALYTATAIDGVAYSLAALSAGTSRDLEFFNMTWGQLADVMRGKSLPVGTFTKTMMQMQDTLGKMGGSLLQGIESINEMGDTAKKAEPKLHDLAKAAKAIPDAFSEFDADATEKGMMEFDKIVAKKVEAAERAEQSIKDAIGGVKFDKPEAPAKNYYNDIDVARDQELQKVKNDQTKETGSVQEKYNKILETIKKAEQDHIITMIEAGNQRKAAEQALQNALVNIDKGAADERKNIEESTDQQIVASIYKLTGIMTEEYQKQEEARIHAQYDADIQYLEEKKKTYDFTAADQDALDALHKKEEDALDSLLKKTEAVGQGYVDMGNDATEASGKTGAGGGTQASHGSATPGYQGLDADLADTYGAPWGNTSFGDDFEKGFDQQFQDSGALNSGSAPKKRYATGGVADQPSIFGEAGPEAAVPLPDGSKIPVQLSGGGGGDLHLYFPNATMVTKSGAREIEKILAPVRKELASRNKI